MEVQVQDDELYGVSKKLHIPRLEIKDLMLEHSTSPSCFSYNPMFKPPTLSRPWSEEIEMERGPHLTAALEHRPDLLFNVQVNEVIIIMINSFVDFFIQYYCSEYNKLQTPLLLEIKKIIFHSTHAEPSLMAARYDSLVIPIIHRVKARWRTWKESDTYFFPKNVGRELIHNPEHIKGLEERLTNLTESQKEATTSSHMAQLQEEVTKIKETLDRIADDKMFLIFTKSHYQQFQIFFLLFLSFHILSISGFFLHNFETQIQELDDIRDHEIARGEEESFILQYLPNDRTAIEIIKGDLLLFFAQQSIGISGLKELGKKLTVEEGGSKRVHNKSRKNKSRKYKNKRRNRTSKHSRRHRRKRMQSNQNKMF
jgi:hypothetical protein